MLNALQKAIEAAGTAAPMISEYRILDMSKLRCLCIDRGWCDHCNNRQYDELLNLCNNEYSNQLVYEIATLIEAYSDTSVYGLSRRETLEAIMFEIVHEATYTTFTIEGGNEQ